MQSPEYQMPIRTRFSALLALLLALPMSVSAAPVCEVSDQGMVMIMKVLCGTQGDVAPNADCVSVDNTRTDILEATVVLASLSKCSESQRALVDSAFIGLRDVQQALAALARCTGVEIDVPALIADVRGEVEARGPSCPTGDGLHYATAMAEKFSRMQDFLPGLYAEAGVAIDAEGNVRESVRP